MSAPLEPSPYTTAIERLLELRWAEAEATLLRAEGDIAHWASVEAQIAAQEDRSG